jgi:UPF0716 protein FxsA
MGKLLFLLFTVVPVLELWLLVEVGQLMGAGPTIGLVLLTGLIGAALAKREGMRVIREWQGAMAEARLPKDGVLSGLLVLVGGVLLVTPGMVTDVLGFSLLLPPTRRAIAAIVRRHLEKKIAEGSVVMTSAYAAGSVGFGGPGFGGPGFGPSGFGQGAPPTGQVRPASGDVIDMSAD